MDHAPDGPPSSSSRSSVGSTQRDDAPTAQDARLLGARAAEDRERRSLAERRSRTRRADRSQAMRTRVVELEQLVLALRLVPAAEKTWEEGVTEDTKRLCRLLRRLAPLYQNVTRLARHNATLQQLVTEHKHAWMVMRHVLESSAQSEDWDEQVWAAQELARRHFRPWSAEKIQETIDAALFEMQQFALRDDTQSSDMLYMGWRETRRLVPNSTVVQFNFEKIHIGYTLEKHLTVSWRFWSEQEEYAKVMLGGRSRVCLDIIQHVSPKVKFIRFIERHPEMPVTVHKLFLLAHVETDDGAAVQIVKGVEDEDLKRVICGPMDLWTMSAYWLRFENVDRSRDTTASRKYRCSVGGTLDVGDLSFLPRWFSELLAVVIRAEMATTGQYPFTFS